MSAAAPGMCWLTCLHDGMQEMALLDVRKEISFCAKAGCRVVGVVENMAGFVCPHCNITSQIFPPSREGHGSIEPSGMVNECHCFRLQRCLRVM